MLVVERLSPKVDPTGLSQSILREIARDVQSKLALKKALEGEVSEKVRNSVFTALVFGEGILVTARDSASSATRTLDELLFPRSSLESSKVRDTVSTVVRESLQNLDDLLPRAKSNINIV